MMKPIPGSISEERLQRIFAGQYTQPVYPPEARYSVVIYSLPDSGLDDEIRVLTASRFRPSGDQWLAFADVRGEILYIKQEYIVAISVTPVNTSTTNPPLD
jgi:hypothetical protein